MGVAVCSELPGSTDRDFIAHPGLLWNSGDLHKEGDFI
jgi:hypothetical protein